MKSKTDNKINAAKLKGTTATHGIRNKREKITLLVNFSLSGANIAPNVAAINIDVITQQIIPTIIHVFSNIRLIIIYLI